MFITVQIFVFVITIDSFLFVLLNVFLFSNVLDV